MAKERILGPPNWADWCHQCKAYRPHGTVSEGFTTHGGYCSECGTQHSSKAAIQEA